MLWILIIVGVMRKSVQAAEKSLVSKMLSVLNLVIPSKLLPSKVDDLVISWFVSLAKKRKVELIVGGIILF